MEKVIFMCVCFFLIVLDVSAQDADSPRSEAMRALEAYPETMDGLERYTIWLSEKEDETFYKVEIVAGKIVEVDNCNLHTLQGKLNEYQLKDNPYEYYVFETEENVLSTSVGCLGARELRFVHSPNYTIDYSSQLPIVIYLSKGLTIKYRIKTVEED